jgi:hypothetical protein
MSAQLNHTIVWSLDRTNSARFLAESLGRPAPSKFGHFDEQRALNRKLECKVYGVERIAGGCKLYEGRRLRSGRGHVGPLQDVDREGLCCIRQR